MEDTKAQLEATATSEAVWKGNYKLLCEVNEELRSELAALKKPVEEGEIAEWLDHVLPYLYARARDPEDAEHLQDLATLLRRLFADKARMEEALRLVDEDVRHHLRSDVVAPALLRPHAIKAVRAALPKQKQEK